MAYVEPGADGRYEDAVHRISDDMNTVLAAEGIDVAGNWMIFGLRDGKPWAPWARLEFFPTNDAARASWKSLKPAVLIMLQPDGHPPRSVAIYLTMQRQAYDAGYRLTTGTHDPSLIMDAPMRIEDLPRGH